MHQKERTSALPVNTSLWIIGHFLEVAGYLMALILIPRILLERRHPGATIAWVMAIGLIPVVGVPLYFLIGGKRIQKIRNEKRWSMADESTPPHLPEDVSISPDGRRIATLLMRSGTFPLTSDNDVRLIDDGAEAYATLVGMIKDARESIEIATFILGRDDVGRALVSLLARKAEEGVKVRLLLDALGCLRTRGRFVQPIRDAGGQVGIFLPLLPIRRKWSANLRNHRKIVIVDRKRAMLGGMNLAKEYMGPSPYEKRWKDVSLTVEGSGVNDILTVFMQDWTYTTGEDPDCGMPSRAVPYKDGDGSMVQVVGDGPDILERPLYSGVLAALGQARESIWVVTPYFVPDEPLSAALAMAARLGVDVRVVIPERSNHPLVDLAGRSFLPDLMTAGVRFYFYRPRMLHAKLIAIDRRLAMVGTANMDMRSFHLNFEIATFLYSPGDVQQVSGVIESIIEESRQVTTRDTEDKGKIRRFSEEICRVFSPLL